MLAFWPHPIKDPRPDPEERFAVRNLKATLEIEQGLADLRTVLYRTHEWEEEEALEGLRERVRGAVWGLGDLET